MTLLKTKINLEQVNSWSTTKTLGGTFVKKMFGSEHTLTIGEILNREMHPHFKNWVLLREQVVTPRVLHQVAQYLTETFIEQQKDKGIYIDCRTEKLVEAKQRWLDNKIGSEILAVHQRTAGEIEEDIAEFQDEDVNRLAHLVKCLLQTDATKCYELVYSNTTDFIYVVGNHKKGEFSTLWTQRLDYLKSLFTLLDNDKDFINERIQVGEKAYVQLQMEV